jgi:CheY-like chemotaxis protein
MGIPPDVLPHIFEPFFTTKESGGGTGLGLAQVDGIVEQLGGTVGVDSRLGRGTVFAIYLPLVESARRTPGESGQRPAVARRGERILVVEGSPQAREALSDAVRMLGYQVLLAGSGREALAVAESRGEEIDLLMAEAQLADMQAADLCRTLRRRRPGLPCLLMDDYGLSGQSQTEIVDENTLHIQKPFTLEALGECLRRALHA